MLCVHTRLNGCLTQDILPQESVKVWRQEGGPPPPAPSPPLQPVLLDCNQRAEASVHRFLFQISSAPSCNCRIRWHVPTGRGDASGQLQVPLVMGGGRPHLSLW